MRFLLFSLAIFFAVHSVAPKAHASISEQQRKVRLSHAKELLGSRYSKSVARNGENVKKINSMVYAWTRDNLRAKYKAQYQKIAQTIIDEALKHEFDPVFLLSVIESESAFNPEARGGAGEIGMMQLMPSTAEWMVKETDVKWQGKQTLLDPIANIKIGAVYLAYLRDKFDSHARLYLAAYNMGSRKVREILERKIWPKDYPRVVMRHYIEFYASLKEKPRA